MLLGAAAALATGCGGAPSASGPTPQAAAPAAAANRAVAVELRNGDRFIADTARRRAVTMRRKRPTTTTAPTSTAPRSTASTTTTTRPPAPAGRRGRPPRRTTTTAPPRTSGGSGSSGAELQVLELVNAERAKRGCGPLREDARLARAARGHSQDMLARGYFSHQSPDAATRTPSDRAARQGYPSGVGENIAAGYPTPRAAVAGWMASSGHRANILNCRYASTGAGFASGGSGYRTYWTQMFGNA